MRFVLVLGIVIGANLVDLDKFWQMYLKEINMPVIFIGILSLTYLIYYKISQRKYLPDDSCSNINKD